MKISLHMIIIISRVSLWTEQNSRDFCKQTLATWCVFSNIISSAFGDFCCKSRAFTKRNDWRNTQCNDFILLCRHFVQKSRYISKDIFYSGANMNAKNPVDLLTENRYFSCPGNRNFSPLSKQNFLVRDQETHKIQFIIFYHYCSLFFFTPAKNVPCKHQL